MKFERKSETFHNGITFEADNHKSKTTVRYNLRVNAQPKFNKMRGKWLE